MVERSTNLNDFMLFLPCCGVLFLLILVVGGVLLALKMMDSPQQAQPEQGNDEG